MRRMEGSDGRWLRVKTNEKMEQTRGPSQRSAGTEQTCSLDHEMTGFDGDPLNEVLQKLQFDVTRNNK